jgi:hypothetical protein
VQFGHGALKLPKEFLFFHAKKDGGCSAHSTHHPMVRRHLCL